MRAGEGKTRNVGPPTLLGAPPSGPATLRPPPPSGPPPFGAPPFDTAPFDTAPFRPPTSNLSPNPHPSAPTFSRFGPPTLHPLHPALSDPFFFVPFVFSYCPKCIFLMSFACLLILSRRRLPHGRLSAHDAYGTHWPFCMDRRPCD